MKIPDWMNSRFIEICKYEFEYESRSTGIKNISLKEFLFTKNLLYFARIFVDFSRIFLGIFRKQKYENQGVKLYWIKVIQSDGHDQINRSKGK